MAATPRVIVIGGGIVGASTAYHLAVAGADVLLVDRRDEGQATAAGAGVIFPWPLPGESAQWAAVCGVAAAHWPVLLDALADEGITDPGYAPVGGISVVEERPMIETLYEGTLQMRETSAPGLGEIRRLEPGEPRDLFPVLSSELGGVWVAGIGRVDGRVLRDALVEAAVRRGTQQRVGAAALSVSNGRVAGVEIDGEVVPGDAVVAAAGAWTAELCRPLGIDVPVFPLRGQIVHLKVAGLDTDRAPVVQTATGYYLLGFPGGRVIAGSTREDVGFNYRSSAAGVHEILTAALAVAPDLAQASLEEVRVGFRPASRDILPLIGPVGGLPGLVVASGLGANGLTLGPVTGSIAADTALGRPAPLDLAPYRPDRPG